MKSKFTYTYRACYLSAFIQAIVCNFTPLLFAIFKTSFGISFEMLGRLILFNFVTQIIVDLIAVKYVDKIGYRLSAILSQAFIAVGLILMGILPNIISPYVGISLSVIIFAIGGAITEVVTSPIVESLPSDNKASSMAFLHSFFCWGQIVVIIITSLLIKLCGSEIWTFICVMWSILPIFCLILFVKVPMAPPLPSDKKFSLKTLSNVRFFLVALLVMVCGGAAEQTIAQWSSIFAEHGLKVSKLMGDLLGPCLFATFMLLGRILLSKYSEKISLINILAFCSVFSTICYLIIVFAPNPFISLLSCGLCGLAVSVLWPGTLSLCAKNIKNGGAAMFGLLAVFGDLGCSLGSWITGIVSDRVTKSSSMITFSEKIGVDISAMGLKAGILVACIFPVLMLIGLILLRNFDKE